MPDMPELAAGETAIVATAAAIANSVRETTDVRLPRFPLDTGLLAQTATP